MRDVFFFFSFIFFLKKKKKKRWAGGGLEGEFQSFHHRKRYKLQETYGGNGRVKFEVVKGVSYFNYLSPSFY